jgi:hypothetical protein
MTKVFLRVVLLALGDRGTRVQVSERATTALDEIPRPLVDPEPIVASAIEQPRVIGVAKVAGHVLRHEAILPVRLDLRLVKSRFHTLASTSTTLGRGRDVSLATR